MSDFKIFKPVWGMNMAMESPNRIWELCKVRLLFWHRYNLFVLVKGRNVFETTEKN